MTPHPNTLHLTSAIFDTVEYCGMVFRQTRVAAGLSIAERTITIHKADVAAISNAVGWGSEAPMSVTDGRETLLHDDSVSILLKTSSDTIEITVSGDPARVTELADDILPAQFNIVSVQVKWMYKPGDYVRLPVDNSTLPVDSFYPGLEGETLADYYARFMESRANILVLIGPPGTGKTSFIRGLLHTTRSRAILSYDAAILEHDEIFAEFMSGSETVMVLEDADTFLSSRAKHGNTVMHKFLNIGDGLLSTRGKKIVFTTNLPSVRDIDEALLRPGRCFDVMRFGKLTAAQAGLVREDYPENGPDITLAELMNGDRPERSDRVGFVR
jgi:hypothetical protein